MNITCSALGFSGRDKIAHKKYLNTHQSIRLSIFTVYAYGIEAEFKGCISE